MESSIVDLQEKLTSIVAQKEKERLQAHENAMKELADARAKEEERQNSAREEQRIAIEKSAQRKRVVQEAEEERTREEANLRRLVEQEANRKQEELERIVQLKEDIKKRLDEMEHAEELAKKQLRDVILQLEPRVDTERIMPNPLAKFFQPQE